MVEQDHSCKKKVYARKGCYLTTMLLLVNYKQLQLVSYDILIYELLS